MCDSPGIGDRTWDLTALQNAPPATPLPSAKPRSSGTKTVNSALDMARIVDRLTQPELQRCDLDLS